MNEAIQNLISSGRVEKGMWWEKAWRLVEGCQKISMGCTYCWSERQAHLRSSNPKMQAQYGGVTTPDGKWNGKIKLLKQNLELPLKRKKPTVWAIWNDLFCADYGWFKKTMNIIEQCPQHIFIMPTKRPNKAYETILKWNCESIKVSNLPNAMSWGNKQFQTFKNIWLGVTAESQEQADKRIPTLLQIPAAVRFVSVEPLLGPVDLSKWLFCGSCNETPSPYGRGVQEDLLNNAAGGKPWSSCSRCGIEEFPRLNWVICGTENLGGRPGQSFPRCAEAIRALKNQCVEANAPFFFKQAPNSLFETAETGQHKMVKMPKLDGQIYDQLPGRM